MIALCIALMFGFICFFPAAIRHDNELPISATGKVRK